MAAVAEPRRVHSKLHIRRGGRMSGLHRRVIASHRSHARLDRCSLQAAPPPPDELLDCFMGASMLSRRPRHEWQQELARELLDDQWWPADGQPVPPVQSPSGHVVALAAQAALERQLLEKALAGVRRWHLETQDRLFGHLRSIWADDRPRTMLDLGAHAHAGRFRNVSDALLWLDHFNHSGGLVVGVDALEDFALDLQHRFDHAPPYATMAGVRKRALFRAVGVSDNVTLDLFFGVAKPMMAACATGWDDALWKDRDHHCRIPRQRLGLLVATAPPPPSSHPGALFATLRRGNTTRRRWPPYLVRQARADTLYSMLTQPTSRLWMHELGGRRVDFVKVDVDLSWRRLGLETLITQRAFGVMVLEIDESWGAQPRPRPWGVSDADQLVWLAGRHGFASFLKVPCRARRGRAGRGFDFDAAWAASYHPLGNSTRFVPAATTARLLRRANPHLRGRRTGTQDVLLVDERDPARLVERLRGLGLGDCA